jgi:superfamily II DNA/RNA helicase
VFHNAETILAAMPKKKQTLLFSATMPKELTGTVGATVKEPIFKYEVRTTLSH